MTVIMEGAVQGAAAIARSKLSDSLASTDSSRGEGSAGLRVSSPSRGRGAVGPSSKRTPDSISACGQPRPGSPVLPSARADTRAIPLILREEAPTWHHHV